jgi:hypothetical protein
LPVSNTEYLEIGNIRGSASAVSTGDEGGDPQLNSPFDVSSYSLGSSGSVLQPLTVTVDNGPGASTLALDAQNGTTLTGALTLDIVNSNGVLIQQDTLSGVKVVAAAIGGNESAFAFDYSSITITPYTVDSNGNGSEADLGDSVSVSTSNDTFAAPDLPTLPGTPADLSLDVSAATLGGREYSSLSFTPASYNFSVAAGGTGPLNVDLGAGDGTSSVAQIEREALVGVEVRTVTLTQTHPEGNSSLTLEKITLTNAVVTGYTDAGGDVSVTFDYSSASVTSSYLNNGQLFDTTTVTLDDAACYCRGTRLTTPMGSCAIEALAVGDELRTANGALRRVRWLGFRGIDCTRYADPKTVWPIRILRDAIAPGVPARDLCVSPGHGILIDGALVQAGNLVNGATILQESRDSVEYWHVELDTLDIVLAENLPAESYLDTGNRTAFINGGAFLEIHPDFQPRHWADTCVPLVLEGPALVAARRTLLARAASLGFFVSDDADLHLLADGRRIEPVRLGKHRVAFLVDRACDAIELRCHSFVPAHVNPESSDRRDLGICVTRLQLNGADVPLDESSAFGQGWHHREIDGSGHQHRWTSDWIRLPTDTQLIVLELGSRGRYWHRPESTAARQELEALHA